MELVLFLQNCIPRTNLPMEWACTECGLLGPEQPAVSKMQMKPPKRCHLTPTRVAAIKKADDKKCWPGCGETGALTHCWVLNGSAAFENSLAVPQKVKQRVDLGPSNRIPRRVPKRSENLHSHRNSHTDVQSSIIRHGQKMKTPQWPSMGERPNQLARSCSVTPLTCEKEWSTDTRYMRATR